MFSAKTKSAIISIAASTLALPAMAEQAKDPGESETKDTGGLHAAFSPTKPDLTREELLTDIRDARLSLAQVKQQAVNLFLEATRTLVTMKEPALETCPQEISKSMLNEKAKYIAPRKEWLVYYINTLEPIIHLMSDDLKDVEENGLHAPKIIQEKIDPLWKPWKEEVVSINKSMDEIQSLIAPESGTNIPLAKTALSIYDRACRLEKLRFKAAQICRQSMAQMDKKSKSTVKKKTNQKSN